MMQFTGELNLVRHMNGGRWRQISCYLYRLFVQPGFLKSECNDT
jgi:hypothetical protein